MPRLATSSLVLAALFAAGCEVSPTETEADTAWAESDASTAGNDAALTDDDAVAPNADAAPEPVEDDDYDLTEVTIARLLAAQAKGTLDAAEILEWHLARLQAYDNAGPGLRSLRRVSPDVQQQAEAQHGPDSAGPLRGIVVTVKDNIDVAGRKYICLKILMSSLLAPDLQATLLRFAPHSLIRKSRSWTGNGLAVCA